MYQIPCSDYDASYFGEMRGRVHHANVRYCRTSSTGPLTQQGIYLIKKKVLHHNLNRKKSTGGHIHYQQKISIKEQVIS